MKNVPGQVLNELGELGKSILTETVKAPGAIAGEAIPGVKSSASFQKAEEAKHPDSKPSPLDELTQEKDQTRLLGIARKALEYIAVPRQKEPTVRERLDREEADAKQRQEETAVKEARMAPVAPPKGKKRGDLFGTKQSTEKSPNVRQD